MVAKDELIREIWAGTFVTDNALTRVIAQIRKQLGDNARSPRFIETVATTGYRFVADVAEEAGSVNPATDPAPPAAARPAPAAWAWRVPAALAGVIAVAAAAWWLGRAREERPPHFTGFQQITSSAASDLSPAFSPDGSQIAFSSNRSGRFEIYVRSLAPGGAERQLTSEEGNNVQPAWRPNGQEIAFVNARRGAIEVVPVSGGVPRSVVDTGAGENWSPFASNTGAEPDWSPDGRTLVYSAGAVGKIHLWLARLDGSPKRPLTQPGTPPGDHQYARWLSDGRHVAFSAFFPTKGLPWVVDTVTGELQPIQIAADSVPFPCWPGDGRSLYFANLPVTGATIPTDAAGIWRARIDSRWRAQKPELLIPFSGEPAQDMAVSADGSRIAIAQARRETALWSLALDPSGLAAGDPKPLIRDGSMVTTEPSFSPDGSKLAYASLRQGGEWTILMAGPDGSSPTPVSAAGQSSQMISWIGNQTLAYVADQGGRKAYWIAPLNGPPRRVDLKLDLGPYAFLKASPEGHFLVAHSGDRKIGIQLVIFDLATGASRVLTPPGRTFVFPSWSPDTRWIAAVERIDPNLDHLVAIEVATGKIHNLGDLTDDPTYFRTNWAPDSDRIGFARLRDGASNIYWVSRSSGKVQQVTRFDSQNERVAMPAWSPQGDRMVFQHSLMGVNIYAGELRN